MNIEEFWKKNNCYQNGEYYQSLLPEYSWEGLSDTEYLDSFLEEHLESKIKYALELAAGSGRGTRILLKYADQVTAVEMNWAMLESFRCLSSNLVCIRNDMDNFVRNNPLEIYKLVFSFWGPYLSETSTEAMLSKTTPRTKGFFFHAHRGGIEQRLIREVLHNFKDARYNNKDTSDKENAFRKVLEKYKAYGKINYCVEEVFGEARFRSLDFALESFLNFHFAGVFEKPIYFEVAHFLEERMKKYLQDNEVRIHSGIKIFSFVKN